MTGVTAIRGAVQAAADTAEAIHVATAGLLDEILERNGLDSGRVVAVWFTQTADLRAAVPASTARQRGWDGTACLCAQEPAVGEGLPRVIRVLVLARGLATPPRHAYLGAAAALRPDLDPVGGADG